MAKTYAGGYISYSREDSYIVILPVTFSLKCIYSKDMTGLMPFIAAIK